MSGDCNSTTCVLHVERCGGNVVVMNVAEGYVLSSMVLSMSLGELPVPPILFPRNPSLGSKVSGFI